MVNTGNTAVSDIVLVDDQLGPITCPLDTLGVGEEMRCTATGTAERGQYANTATVTGVDEAGNTVSDEDPSHYFGFVVEVDIEKSPTARTPTTPPARRSRWATRSPGPTRSPTPVTSPCADIVVTDDQGVTPVFQGGDTNGDDLLDPGETWVYEATGTAEVGQYANVATVDGLADVEDESR